VLVTLALSLTATPEALAGGPAEPTCKDREVATAHFKRGNQLYEQKKLEGALAAFRDSRMLCPSENNTLNIALLLKDLDRPIDALDMLDILEHDFPALLPTNAESVKELRAALEQLVGTVVFDGDYPDARILVDGKEVGTMPQARPLKLRVGTHKARIEMAGHQPLDTNVYVMPKANVQVGVALAVTPTVHQENPSAVPEGPMRSSFHFGAGLSLTPGMGGKVTDCDTTCSAPPGLGALLIGGYRHQFMPYLSYGATAGYLFLWQSRSQTSANLLVGGGRQLADVKDSLFLNAFFAGPEISASFDAGSQVLDLGFSLGPIAGPLVNSRTPQNGRSPVDGTISFDFVPTTKASTSGFGGIFVSLQASVHTRWSLAPGWPLHLTMGVLGFAPMNVPEYHGTFTAHLKNSPGQDRSAEFDERLIGSWSLVFTPGITVYHDL
jgi:PEGA domain